MKRHHKLSLYIKRRPSRKFTARQALTLLPKKRRVLKKRRRRRFRHRPKKRSKRVLRTKAKRRRRRSRRRRRKSLRARIFRRRHKRLRLRAHHAKRLKFSLYVGVRSLLRRRRSVNRDILSIRPVPRPKSLRKLKRVFQNRLLFLKRYRNKLIASRPRKQRRSFLEKLVRRSAR